MHLVVHDLDFRRHAQFAPERRRSSGQRNLRVRTIDRIRVGSPSRRYARRHDGREHYDDEQGCQQLDKCKAYSLLYFIFYINS